MKHIKEWRQIEEAIASGIIRKPGERAAPNQTLTYILSDKKYFHHANLRSAKSEKEFLETVLGKDLKLYKVWNISRETAEADFKLIRSKLSSLSSWDVTFEAVDRIIAGAGY